MELIQKKLWKFHVPIVNIIWDIAATSFEISWNTQNKKIAKEVNNTILGKVEKQFLSSKLQ